MPSRRILNQSIICFTLAFAAITAPVLASAQQQEVPSAPSASPIKFSEPPAMNFTATSPSRATVEAFLKESWGYDQNRVYQVWAILKTPAPGVSRVVVQVAQKNDPQHQTATASFLVTPDGKHLIANDLTMLAFGDHPYAEAQDILMQGANGPTRGAASVCFACVFQNMISRERTQRRFPQLSSSCYPGSTNQPNLT